MIAAILVVATLFTARSVSGVLASAPVLAALATGPVAVIRRFPATAIGIVLGASAIFIFFGRLSWPAPAIAAG